MPLCRVERERSLAGLSIQRSVDEHKPKESDPMDKILLNIASDRSMDSINPTST